jgi:hypothetical protein
MDSELVLKSLEYSYRCVSKSSSENTIPECAACIRTTGKCKFCIHYRDDHDLSSLKLHRKSSLQWDPSILDVSQKPARRSIQTDVEIEEGTSEIWWSSNDIMRCREEREVAVLSILLEKQGEHRTSIHHYTPQERRRASQIYVLRLLRENSDSSEVHEKDSDKTIHIKPTFNMNTFNVRSNVRKSMSTLYRLLFSCSRRQNDNQHSQRRSSQVVSSSSLNEEESN